MKSRKGQRTQQVVEVSEPGELVRLYDADVSLVWWRLPALPDAETVLSRDPFVWTGEVSAAGTELEALGPLVDSASVLERARMLVELHCSLFEVDAVGVRVTLTQTPLCPSFHVSRQHCQLLTALAGDGTQWVRGALYAVNETSVVEQLPPAAVGWFKGREWPDIMPVAHRSPPGTARRLVMSIDLL